MEIVELKKIIDYIIDTYGDLFYVYPHDYELIIEFRDIKELDCFCLDRDEIKTFEDFSKYEQEVIIPELRKLYQDLSNKQSKTEKMLKALDYDLYRIEESK